MEARSDFEKIYRETYKKMFCAAIAGAGKYEDAEDVLQNVYSAFYRRTLSKGCPCPEEAALILKKALKHELYRLYGRSKRRPVYIEDLSGDGSPELTSLMAEDFSDGVFASVAAERVWEEIKNKGDLTARIFILRFRLELSLREISQTLGINEATVTNRLYRTVNDLKKLFEDGELL